MLIVSIVSTVLLIALDQFTKQMAVNALYPHGTQPFIPGFLQFRYIENTGAAFSSFTNMTGFLIVVTAIALLAVAFVLFIRRPKDRLETISLVFIFSGGVGNLIDRIAKGYVVDFLEFQFIQFPVFNVADCLVCIGFVLLIIAFIRMELRDRKQKKLKQEQEAGKDAVDAAD